MSSAFVSDHTHNPYDASASAAPQGSPAYSHSPYDKSVGHKVLKVVDDGKPVRYEHVTGKRFVGMTGAMDLYHGVPPQWWLKHCAVRHDCRPKQHVAVDLASQPLEYDAYVLDKQWQTCFATWVSMRWNVLVSALRYDKRQRVLTLVLRDAADVDAVLAHGEWLVWQGPWVVEAVSAHPTAYDPTHVAPLSRKNNGVVGAIQRS
mgnify:CR=1 FL=1